jgi:citrate synthase
MKALSQELAGKLGDMHWHFLCEKIEEVMMREKGLHHNLDFYAGPILNMLGLPTELSTTVFAAGRVAGWSAHIIEQLDNNRLIRPRFEYQGPKGLSYQPIGIGATSNTGGVRACEGVRITTRRQPRDF